MNSASKLSLKKSCDFKSLFEECSQDGYCSKVCSGDISEIENVSNEFSNSYNIKTRNLEKEFAQVSAEVKNILRPLGLKAIHF